MRWRAGAARAPARCVRAGSRVSFVRCGGPYRTLYDERKMYLAAHHPEWPAKRVHLAAVRATVKRFLADLWVAWSEAEGAGSENTTAEAR